ncbi:MAG TPA: hypothetical protein VM074_12515 [Solimonas sp.]|nr:hypothetical protein [Solimonas sp.]
MRKHLASIILLGLAGSAAAADPFSARLTIDNSSPVERGYTSIEDLLEQFSNERLQEVAPTYTPISAAVGEINLRGLSGVTLSYEQNSPVLDLRIASLGVHEQFNGATRDESEDLLEEWFKGDGREVLTRLFNQLAELSPIDPVAGNPNSLMAKMVESDFANATQLPQVVAKATDGDGPRNFVGISARMGQYSQREFSSQVLSLPLSYTHLLEDRRYALVIDVPLTYVRNEGAKTYSGSLGVGLRLPAAERWSLVPALRVGAVGSPDLGSGGVIYSGSLTSHYAFEPLEKFNFAVADMLAYYSTGSVKVGDYDTGYDLSNTVLRNGLLVDRDAGFSLWGAPMQWDVQLVRTDYFGDALYSRYYHDLSVSLGTRKQAGALVWNALRVGLTYTNGDGDVRGAAFNLGYTF